jgi:hypothetical protein
MACEAERDPEALVNHQAGIALRTTAMMASQILVPA